MISVRFLELWRLSEVLDVCNVVWRFVTNEVPPFLPWPHHAFSEQMKGKLREASAWFVCSAALKAVKE